jgi:predicted nucleic acid-binding protein
MSDRVFVDTNVFVYAVDTDEPQKRARAIELLAELEERIVISAQVLTEYFVTVTRKLARPESPQRAERAVRTLARMTVVDVDRALALAAVSLSRASQLSVWDAAIIAAAQRAGCALLYSEDLSAGQVFDGVTVGLGRGLAVASILRNRLHLGAGSQRAQLAAQAIGHRG